MKHGNGECRNEHVEFERNGDEIRLSIIGDFDSITTSRVHECCKSIGNAEGIRRIVLDFKRAGRVGVSAFACIIGFIKEHKGTGTEIVVTHLHEPAQELLHLLKIEKIVRVV